MGNIEPYKILLHYPTRGRPQKSLFYLKKYVDLLDDKGNSKIILSCDTDDLSMNNDDVKNVVSRYDNVEIYFANNKTKVEAGSVWNDKYDFDIHLNIQDDMFPIVRGYDNIIRLEMYNAFIPDTDGVLFFSDGRKSLDGVCCITCVGRKYYDRFGYIVHPKYKSFFGDNELTEVSTKLNRIKKTTKMLFKHNHPTIMNDISAFDELFMKNQGFWEDDENLFNERKMNNFYIQKEWINNE